MHPVGRDGEHQAIGEWVDEGLGGRPRLVLVAGEGGIGKTHLIDARREALLEQGTTTAVGLVPEQPGAPPFWPWRQIEAQLDGRDLFAATEGTDPEVDRFAQFEAVRTWVVDRARSGGGLVLVIEDLHRADLPSSRMLAHLVLHMTDEPLVIVATHRSEAGDHVPGFADVLEQLRRWHGTRRVDLQGLDPPAVAALLDEATAAPIVDRVIEVSGGNPLLVRELALHLASGADPSAVPRSVRDAVAARLAHRSAACVEALRVAAVIGRDFAAGVLATVLDRPALTVLEVLDEASGAGFVAPGDAPGRFRFVHLLVRDAVEATLGAAEVAALHRRVAEAIETYEGTGDDQLSDLARHWDEASALGERARAADWCERAAAAADRRLAWEEAVRLYDRAVELGGTGGDPLDRHRRLLGSARARLHVETLDHVVDRCVQAAAAVAGLDRPDLVAEAALVAEARGGPDATLLAVRGIAEAALAGIDPSEHTLRARLLGLLAHLAFYLDLRRCEPLTAEALAAAEAAGDPLAMVAAVRARQMVRAVPEGAQERLELAGRIGELGRQLERPSLQVWEPIWRIDALLELGRVPEAVATLGDLRRLVTAAPLPMPRWHLARIESVLAQATGRFADALEAGARARDLFAVLENPHSADSLFLALENEVGCQVGHEPGGFERWEALLRSTAIPTFLGDLPWIGPIPSALAAGRTDVARASYAKLAPVPTWVVPPFMSVALLTYRAIAALALDLSDDLAALVERMGPLRGQHVVSAGGAVNYSGCVDRYLGRMELVLGRWDDAVSDLRQALAIAEEAATPTFAAETAADLAHALVGRGGPGDGDEAGELAARYRPVAAAHGMAPWLDRFDALPSPAMATGGPLSPRELEVAGLVADGLTNKQIAAALFLSERTAQNHVQHILTKLGLANRTRVAAWYRDR